VGELWDTHAGAEMREYDKKDAEVSEYEISEQIIKMRAVVEETASFQRARSLAGALFQVALAHAATVHLYELIPSEKRAIFCGARRNAGLLKLRLIVCLRERDAEPVLFPPYDAAMPARLIGLHNQREFVGNS
jgi:hypothetical protein